MEASSITKKNTREITIKQHVISQELMRNFCNSDMHVSVHDLKNNRRYFKKTKNIFYTKRSWGTWAEKRYMKKIEDDFHKVMKETIDNRGSILPDTSKDENEIILEYILLCHLRFSHATNSLNHCISNLVEKELTQNQKEELGPAGAIQQKVTV
ncbi:DUF4238 domain-containing protein [Thiotrichales bacterium 19S11-10]|nr:DUF4238 domain-containing protein [Thiotrichales bacterium 19S11-10]